MHFSSEETPTPCHVTSVFGQYLLASRVVNCEPAEKADSFSICFCANNYRQKCIFMQCQSFHIRLTSTAMKKTAVQ